MYTVRKHAYDNIRKIDMNGEPVYFGYSGSLESSSYDHIFVATGSTIVSYKFNKIQALNFINERFTRFYGTSQKKSDNKSDFNCMIDSIAEKVIFDVKDGYIVSSSISDVVTDEVHKWIIGPEGPESTYGELLVQGYLEKVLADGPDSVAMFETDNIEHALNLFLNTEMFNRKFIKDGFTPALKAYFRTEKVIYLVQNKDEPINLPITNALRYGALSDLFADFIAETVIRNDVFVSINTSIRGESFK